MWDGNGPQRKILQHLRDKEGGVNMIKKEQAIIWKLLPLVIFNVVFFTAVRNYSASVICSYIFMDLACLVLVIAEFVTPDVHNRHILKFPLIPITIAYMAIEIVIGSICVVFYIMPFGLAFILQVIPLAVYLLLFSMITLANEDTAKQETALKNDMAFIQRAALDLNNIWAPVQDPALRKRIESVYDAIRGSHVLSTPEAAQLETDIKGNIQILVKAISDGEYGEVESAVNKLLRLINERNKVIQLSIQ